MTAKKYTSRYVMDLWELSQYWERLSWSQKKIFMVYFRWIVLTIEIERLLEAHPRLQSTLRRFWTRIQNILQWRGWAWVLVGVLFWTSYRAFGPSLQLASVAVLAALLVSNLK